MSLANIFFSVVDEEDRAAKYIRVVSASLQALGRFLTMTDIDVGNQVVHYHTSLTAEKKFWKLGRHKSPQVGLSMIVLCCVYCTIVYMFVNKTKNYLTG